MMLPPGWVLDPSICLRVYFPVTGAGLGLIPARFAREVLEGRRNAELKRGLRPSVRDAAEGVCPMGCAALLLILGKGLRR